MITYESVLISHEISVMRELLEKLNNTIDSNKNKTKDVEKSLPREKAIVLTKELKETLIKETLIKDIENFNL